MQIHSFNTLIAEKLGVHKAILLQYIDFWVQKNYANEICIFEGNAWVYHTSKGFAKIFPYIKENTIALYLRQLEEDGYILSQTCDKIEPEKNRSNRTKYYTLTKKYYCLKNAEKIEKKEELEVTKPKNSQPLNFPNEPLNFPNEPLNFPNVYKKLNNNLNKKLNKDSHAQNAREDSLLKFSQEQKEKHGETLESEAKQNIDSLESKAFKTEQNASKDLHNLKEKIKSSKRKQDTLTDLKKCFATTQKSPSKDADDYHKSQNAHGLHEIQANEQRASNQLSTQQNTHKNTEAQFAQIWQEYPRKVSKQNASRIYRKHAKNFEKILSSIKAHKKTQWLNVKEQYIPHLSTFLNQQRYLDELQTRDNISHANNTTLRELKALLGG